MTFSVNFFQRYGKAAIAFCAILLAMPAATSAQGLQQKPASSSLVQGPDLDLSISHYSRVLTAEGVLRESRYEERMLRRPGHVWISRILPKSAPDHDEDHGHENMKPQARKPVTEPSAQAGHNHKHFNHVVLPRHVTREGEKMRLEFVNFNDREVVSIAPTEYENVNFDGSWANAFFLMDPQSVTALPLSNRASSVPGARWREHRKNGLYQRVLWDEKKLIPLVVETGDQAGNFFERVEVKPQTTVTKELPWQKLKNFAQKEYADFLD
jgi:hypothetical protein